MTLTYRFDAHLGDSVASIAVELCAAANHVGGRCMIGFNDVALVAYPDGDPVELVRGYFAAIAAGWPTAVTLGGLNGRLLAEAEAAQALGGMLTNPVAGSA